MTLRDPLSREWEAASFTIQVPPEPAGYYVMGGIGLYYGMRVPILQKPSWLQRWFMRKLLGFAWVDA